MEGPETIILRPFFRHALALVFHLLIIASFIPALCWRRWAGCSNRASPLLIDGSSNPAFTKKLRLGLRYKLILCCCISLAVCHTVIGLWSTVYWWLKKRATNFPAEAEYIIQALAWYIMTYYAYHSFREGRREKFPLLLQICWFSSFILFTFFIILDILLLKDRKIIYPYTWVDIVALSLFAPSCVMSAILLEPVQIHLHKVFKSLCWKALQRKGQILNWLLLMQQQIFSALCHFLG